MSCPRCKQREAILALLKQHPNGLKESEIAEALKTNRRTINNRLRALESAGVLWKDGPLWFEFM